MWNRSLGKRAFALALAGILASGTPVEAALADGSTGGTERIETAGAAEEGEEVLMPEETEEPGESAEMKKAGTDATEEEEGEVPAETAEGTGDNDAGEETGAAGEIGNLDEPEGTEDNDDGAAGRTGSIDEFEGTEGAERTVPTETEVIEESETEDVITLASEKMYRSAAADFEYEVLDETAKTIGITGYRGSQTEVEIPETIDGYMVTSIGDDTFRDCSGLASVTIPGSVTSIGVEAFGVEELFGYYRNLTIYCMEGSYAQQYAIENNIRYQLIGTASKPETKPKDIASCTVTPAVTSCTYTGRPIQPSVTVKDGTTVLTENTDYTVAYADNIKAGTAAVTVSGKGNYEGNRKVSFTIAAKDISGVSVSLPGKQLYTGKAIKPSVTVKDGAMVLTENTDYTVAYADNIKAGTATVTVKGTGNYTGSKKVTFQIIGTVSGVKAISAGYDSVKVSWKQVSGVAGYKVYRAGSKNGKYKCVKAIKGEKTTSCKDTKLTAGKTYYYQVKPYLGKKEGSASKTVSAKPVPARTVLSSVKNPAAKTAAVKWKKVSGASGYEVYRATGKNGKYRKIAAVKKGSTVSCKDTKLKKGKTYYYKVRAYRTVNGRKVYGEFSAVKSVKVKK